MLYDYLVVKTNGLVKMRERSDEAIEETESSSNFGNQLKLEETKRSKDKVSSAEYQSGEYIETLLRMLYTYSSNQKFITMKISLPRNTTKSEENEPY